MADISHELDIIDNGVYGKDVKKALYDALVKVNQDVENVSGGSSSGGEQGLIACDQTINDSALLIPVVIGTPVYEEEENDL